MEDQPTDSIGPESESSVAASVFDVELRTISGSISGMHKNCWTGNPMQSEAVEMGTATNHDEEKEPPSQFPNIQSQIHPDTLQCGSSISTDCSENFDWVLLLKVMGTSAAISFIQLAIPFGTGGQLNPVSYSVYQLVYIVFGVVDGDINYRISVPMIPLSLRRAAVTVAVVAESILIVCYLQNTYKASEIMDLTRGIGLTSYTTTMVVGILIFTFLQDLKIRRQDSLITSEETIHLNVCNIKTAKAIDRAHSEAQSPQITIARGSDADVAESRLSLARVLVLTASVDSPTFAAAEASLVGYSCAHCNSIWRTPLRALSTDTSSDKSSANSTSWTVPIIQHSLNSVILMADFKEEMDFKLIGKTATYQAMLVILSALSRYLLYSFTEWLANYFDAAGAPYGDVGFFVVFIVGLKILRVWFLMVGLWLDMFKTGGLSAQYLIILWITIYYHVFYRGLFVSVRSYQVFLCIKAVHVASELISYQVRYSDFYGWWFTRVYRYIHSEMPAGVSKSIAVIVMGPPLDVHRQRTDLALGLGLYVMLYTSVTFVVYFTFLRFGYNKQFYCLFSSISHEQYERLMIFTVISIVIELAVFAAVNRFSRRKRGYSALFVWQRFLLGQFDTPWRAHVVTIVFSTAHIVVNYYIARLDMSSLGNSDIGC